MNTNITLKELFKIGIFIALTCFFIFISIEMLVNFSKSGKDWISSLIGFLGNIIGGIIGGIVAFIVASYQLNRTLDNEKEKQIQLTKSMLRLIREELNDNISIIESSIPYQDDHFNLLKTQLSDDTWKSTMTNLNVKDNLIIKLNVCYRKITLIRSLNAADIDDTFLSDIKGQFSETIGLIRNELNENN
ncbi:hypothetical protein [Bacillus cereus]|uniref:hypothetical protein n=1 Tax=Bacillus cereus TaxID=1396 RepID=UPI002362C1EB|nr:hypothetical protein [Bacillus cereus]MDD0822777.1 hypothetical protein [Bacillus cereus]